MKTKDVRTTYKGQEIIVNGNRNHFDGKGNPDTKVLKVYRWHGDINQSAEGLQDFALSNEYTSVITEFATF